jgi:hypothetical protein
MDLAFLKSLSTYSQLLIDHGGRRRRSAGPEQGGTASLSLLEDGRVAELCDEAFIALDVGV